MSRLEKIAVQVVPGPLINMAGRAKATVRNRVAARTYGPLIGQLLPGTTSHELVVANDDAVVFRVMSPNGEAILKLATTDHASIVLAAEADALNEIASMETLGVWRSMIAVVTERGEHARGSWMTQSVVPGVATHALMAPSSSPGIDDVVQRAVVALRPLHEQTSITTMADDGVLDQVVSDPISMIKHWRPSVAEPLAALNGECRQRLASLDLVRSRSHGDYAPSNVLWNPETGTVSGIVDWRLDGVLLPPEVDYVHLALTTLMLEHDQEFGHVVVAVLDEDAGAPGREVVAAAAELGPNRFDLRTSVILAWLQHVAFGLDKARELRRNPIWLGKNVDLVARALHPG